MATNEAANRFEQDSSEGSFVVPSELLLGEAHQHVGAGSSDDSSDSSSDAQQSLLSQSDVPFVNIPGGETSVDSDSDSNLGNIFFGPTISTDMAVDPTITVLYPGDGIPLTRSEGEIEREAALARLAQHPEIADQLEQERIGEAIGIGHRDNPQSTQHTDIPEGSENGVEDEDSVALLDWHEVFANRETEVYSSTVYQNAGLVQLPPGETANTSRRMIRFGDELPRANRHENLRDDGGCANEVHRAPTPYPSQQSPEVPYTSDLLHPSPPLRSRYNHHRRYSVSSESGSYFTTMSDTISSSSTVRPAEDAGDSAVPDINTTKLSQVQDAELRNSIVNVVCKSAAALSKERDLPFMIKVDGRLYAEILPNQLHRLSELEGGLDALREMLDRGEHARAQTSLTEETVQNCKAYIEAELEKAMSTADSKVNKAYDSAMQAKNTFQATETKLDKVKQEKQELHEFVAKMRECFEKQLSSLTPCKTHSEDHSGSGGTPPGGTAPRNGPLRSSNITINVTNSEQGTSSTNKGSTTSPHKKSRVSSVNEKAHRTLGIGSIESSPRSKTSRVETDKAETASDNAKGNDGKETKTVEPKDNVFATSAKDNTKVVSPQSKGRFRNENLYGRGIASEEKSATLPSNFQARSDVEHKNVKTSHSGGVEGAGPISMGIDASKIGLAFSTPEELVRANTKPGSINSSDYSGDETSVQKANAEPIKFQKARLVDIPARRVQASSTGTNHGNIGLADTQSAGLAGTKTEKENNLPAGFGHSAMTGPPTASGSAVSFERREDSFATMGKMGQGQSLKASKNSKDRAVSGGPTNTKRQTDPFASGDMKDMMEFLKAKRNAENAENAENIAQSGRVPTTGRNVDPFAGMGMVEKMEAMKAAKISEDLAGQGIAKKPVNKPQGFPDYKFTGPVSQNTPLFSNAPTESEKAFARGLTEKNKLAKSKSMDGFELKKNDGARSMGSSPVKAMAKSIGASFKGMGRSKGNPTTPATHVEQEDC